MNNRRNVKAKKNRGGYLVALIVVIAAMGFALFLKVRNISVEGLSRYSEEEIISISGLETGGNLVLTRTAKATKQLLELPYIKSAEVRREFPDTLVIAVTERKPIAFFETETGFYIVDSDGVVVENFTQPPQNLAKVTGSAYAEPVIGARFSFAGDHPGERNTAVASILEALAETSFYGRITEIRAANLADIRMILDNSLTIEIESSLNLARKFVKLESAIASYDSGELGDYTKLHITDDAVLSKVP